MPFYPEGGDGTPEPFPFTLEDVTDKMAAWAATQPPDNFVNTLECGHEVDTPIERYVGDILLCSVHGPQKIIDPADPPRYAATNDELAEDRRELEHQGVFARFSVQWRDFDDEAVRVCDNCLPKAVRKMYRQYGYTFSVEVRLINESAGFPCEHKE
jgi:hypothetical protein